MYKRILIVDDSIYSREMLKAAIEKKGEYIFVDAESKKETIEKIKQNRKQGREFDYVFLDMELRRDDGFEILREMRELDIRAEVIMTGGISLSDENFSKGIALGVQKFLPKPYKVSDISVMIN